LDVRLWRHDTDRRAYILLLLLWRDGDTIRAHAGDRLKIAILYPEDGDFGLIPDLIITRHPLLDFDNPGRA
jgi:hypothetical protein